MYGGRTITAPLRRRNSARAASMAGAGQLEKAAGLLRQALLIYQQTLGPGSTEYLDAHDRLVRLHEARSNAFLAGDDLGAAAEARPSS